MTAMPQHMQALQYANQIRCANAAWVRTVAAMSPRAGAEFVADAIECDYDHESLGTLAVNRALLAVHRLGQHKAERCLRAAGVANEAKKLRDLTKRQRVAVAAQLRLWAVGYGR